MGKYSPLLDSTWMLWSKQCVIVYVHFWSADSLFWWFDHISQDVFGCHLGPRKQQLANHGNHMNWQKIPTGRFFKIKPSRKVRDSESSFSSRNSEQKLWWMSLLPMGSDLGCDVLVVLKIPLNHDQINHTMVDVVASRELSNFSIGTLGMLE